MTSLPYCFKTNLNKFIDQQLKFELPVSTAYLEGEVSFIFILPFLVPTDHGTAIHDI